MKNAATALLFATAPAFAADWTLLLNNDDVTSFFDKQGITSANGVRKAWILSSYSKPQQLAPYGTYQSAKFQYLYNCKDRSSAVLQVILYPDKDMRTNPIYSNSTKRDHVEFHDVAPDTIGEVQLDAICSAPLSRK